MQTTVLFDGKLQIYIPDDFSHADESEAAEIYPSLERPQVIFANAGFSRFLTFSLLDKLVSADETLSVAKEIRKLIWSLYPHSLLSEAVFIRFGNLRCGGFFFRTGTKESQIYNIMCAVSFENRLLLVTYGCGMDDEDGKVLFRKLFAKAEYIGVEK